MATLARERRQEEQEGVQQEQQEQLLANNEQQGGAMADVANNQAHLFHRFDQPYINFKINLLRYLKTHLTQESCKYGRWGAIGKLTR